MALTLFVTGTDTGVGKTYAACALIHALRAQGTPTRCITFPEDEHGLTKPRTELESFINVLDWLRRADAEAK